MNLQHEFNVHNVEAFGQFILYTTMVMCLSGAALATVGWFVVRDRYVSGRHYLWIPRPALTPGLLSFLAYVWVKYDDEGQGGEEGGVAVLAKLQEPVELIEAVTVLGFVLHNAICEQLRRRRSRTP